MVKKRFIVAALLMFAITPFTIFADQFNFGVGLVTESGEPHYDIGRFPIYLGYESEELWRFSFTNTSFEHENNLANDLEANTLSVERIWVYKIKEGFSLTGGFGPGYFVAKHNNSEGFGSAFGIVASGTLRFTINDKFFLDGTLHYKNAAVKINDGNVNAGYTGLMVGIGFFF